MANDEDEQTDDVRRTVGRRAVVGAAWSVPVISLVTAAPAVADSPGYGLERVLPVNPEISTDFTPSPPFGTGLEVRRTLNGGDSVGSVTWSLSDTTSGLVLGATVTGQVGAARNTLRFPAAPPADGSLGTVTAQYHGAIVVWQVSYRPLTVAQAVAISSPGGATHRVKAFIVGQYDTKGDVAGFDPPFTSDQGVVVADDATERDAPDTLTVLLSRPALQQTWGLLGHPERLGSSVIVTGDLSRSAAGKYTLVATAITLAPAGP